jgi:uncharacterized protein YajQ (UPF0234 family)
MSYMADFSFDVVSSFDKAEMNNVFDQTQREIANRYDFKNTPAAIEWIDSNKNGFKISGSGEWQIEAILDIVRKKLATRNQSQKVLDTSDQVVVSNMQASQKITFKEGLDKEKAKLVTNKIKDSFPKAKSQVQGDSVRVMSSSKDLLQDVMQLLKTTEFDFPLSFTNYR